MSDRSYPGSEPAWVENAPWVGGWSLQWLDENGKPAGLIGIDRECDVPGIHTPEALAAIQAMSVEKQAARMWAQIPHAQETPESAPEA